MNDHYVSLPDLAAELGIKPWRCRHIIKRLKLEYTTRPNGQAGRPSKMIHRDDIPLIYGQIPASIEEAQAIIKQVLALPDKNMEDIAVYLNVDPSSVFNWSIGRSGMQRWSYHKLQQLLNDWVFPIA